MARLSAVALPVALLVALLSPSSLATGGGSVAERATCPYREEERTFGRGAERFNMTVAVGGGAGHCGADRQCQPLETPVLYTEGGVLKEVRVPVAWLCVAVPRVMSSPAGSLSPGASGQDDPCQAARETWRRIQGLRKMLKGKRKQLKKQRKLVKEQRKLLKKQRKLLKEQKKLLKERRKNCPVERKRQQKKKSESQRRPNIKRQRQ